MNLKSLLTVRPSEFNHQKIRKFLSNNNLLLLDFTGSTYGLHTKLIDSVKKIEKDINLPIGIIHAIHPKASDLDLDFALRSGVHALAVPNTDLATLYKIKKKANSFNLPVFSRVEKEPKKSDLKDLIDGFILNSKYLQLFDVKKINQDNKKPTLARYLLDFANHSHAVVLAVGDLELASLLSALNPEIKIAFVSSDRAILARACFLPHIVPTFLKGTVVSSLISVGLIARGQRLINAADLKQGISIELAL